jgi:hypothetical protein
MLLISFFMVFTPGLMRIYLRTVSVGVVAVGAASEFAVEIILHNFRIFGLGRLALKLVGVVGVTFAQRHYKSRCAQVAADPIVYETLRHCFRLQDFEFAVAFADTNDLGELVKHIGLETHDSFWTPARVSADAWLELMGYRRSLVADWTVLLIGHGFHHKLALQCVPRGSRMNDRDYLGCEAALSIALLGRR